MAGEEIYLARMSAWIARALGETGGFASDLDTDALGFQMPDVIAADPAVAAAGAALADAGMRLVEAAEALDAAVGASDNGALVPALIQFVQGIYLYVDGTAALVDRIETAAAALAAAEANAVAGFTGLMARKLIDYLVLSQLEMRLPRTAFLLHLLGLLDWRVVEASGAINAPRFVRKDLKLDRIKQLIKAPAAHFQAVYGWGTPDFDPAEIMDAAVAFFHELAAIDIGKVGGDAFFEYGSHRWSRDSSVNPPGLRYDYTAEIGHNFSGRVELAPEWGTDITADLNIAGGAIFRLKPPFDVSVEPKTGTASGSFRFKTNRNPAARGFTIVGGNDLIHLTAEDFGIGGELVVGAATTGIVTIEPGIFAELKGLKLKLGSKDSDNFLASLLASAEIEGVFDIGLAWTLAQGLKVSAAGGLEIAIPMHQSLGPVTFESLYLILKILDDGSFALETSAAINGRIGPLSVSVERIGAEVLLAFSDGADAELGPLDLKIRFKPPNGVGLAIDAGVVRGGGYLYLDFEKGEYAGAMELVFSGFLAVKAIGLINTRKPDGSPGFSFLIVVTAEFGTPIQLGYGFTLVGLGGLLGLHRTMMLDELAEGVRTGAVESVMFPQDVIANAPRIISDMKRFFPPQEGSFLIGPMAKIGWGTPTIVTLSMGVIVEVPPGNIAILGVLKCVLPDEDAALLVLQVKFIGALEPTKKRLWFFASMFGSRVVFATIGGDMGVIVDWGEGGNSLLSVGGFHPRFKVPALPFPVPQRISLSILNESFARIRVSAYFAVTSNTAQFGARAELYFGMSAFSVDGHLGFDALFQFSPFYFVIDFSASMSVKVFGTGVFSVRVRGTLDGSSPYHVEGEGSISLLFWDIDLPFSHSWGSILDTVLEAIAALPILKTELLKRENWLALPPPGAALSVSLRKIDATQELVLHPVGALRISQRALPLNVDIDKIGNRKVADVSQLRIKVTASGLAEKARVKERFASAQYRDIDGAAKLSAPGYEKMDSGSDISVSGSDTRTSHAVKRIVLHELIIIDSNYKEHIRLFFRNPVEWFTSLLASNATARSPLSKASRAQKIPFADKVRAQDPGFVIASTVDNGAWDGAATFSSQAQALDVLAAQVRANPGAANDLHVIPAAEAGLAA